MLLIGLNKISETEKTLLYAVIYEAVCEIPYGRVATYGQIAKNIGLPRHARHVGFALANLGEEHDIPWYRVVNAKGEVHDTDSNGNSLQRSKLEDEGVVFTFNNRVPLKDYQY